MIYVKSFYDTDIAMMEHDFISENSIMDWRPEDAQFYLMGIHDFASKIIEKIQGKEEKG